MLKPQQNRKISVLRNVFQYQIADTTCGIGSSLVLTEGTTVNSTMHPATLHKITNNAVNFSAKRIILMSSSSVPPLKGEIDVLDFLNMLKL
jgi:hypothetical protein